MAVMQIQLLVYVLCLSVRLSFTLRQSFEGDNCELDGGTSGVCRKYAQCRFAQAQIADGQFPKICSFIDATPIVCCPRTRTRTTQTTPRTKPRTTPRRMWPSRRPARPTTTTTTTTTTEQPAAILEMKGKSWEKCVAYSALVKQEVYSPVLLLNSEKVFEDECAQTAQQLIINGENTAPKEFPHMAALGFGDEKNIAWSCGGSLISERFILTAAHCLFLRGRGYVRWVRLGDLNLYETSDDSRPQTLEVIERIPHPAYKPPSRYNDIALLRLNADATFSAYVRPACLHTNSTTPDYEITTATGWGVTEWTAEKGSNDLMKVDLRFENPERCNATYMQEITGGDRLIRGFQEDSMICAGDVENMRDTCVGDSGGPLQLRISVPYCMYSIVGLTSFGVKSCGVSNSPAVYTRVSYFVPWIENIVWPN